LVINNYKKLGLKMSVDIFIGVDGGATKTKVIVEDDQGNLIAEALSSASNLRLATEVSWRAILDCINAALQSKGISLSDQNYRFHAGFGLSGCELPEAYQKFINTPHPFTTLVVKQDSYTACLGAHNGADGAIIIIGTGVSGIQIQQGKTIQVGGWGFPHDDQGGGAWLGLQAVSLTLQWLDGRLDKGSQLLQLIFQKFENNLSQLITWANTANSNKFAQIAPLVFQQINAGDNIAISLITAAAQHIEKIGLSFIKRTEHHAVLPCSLLGGVANFIQPWLSEEFKARLVTQKHEATVGAILALKQYMINNC
jgi:glucosamine kinase